jgi:hypothetical protein
MLLMPHCKKSSASTILNGKRERVSFRRDITPYCAYAGSGQPAAAPPIDLMNSLRRMPSPEGQAWVAATSELGQTEKNSV